MNNFLVEFNTNFSMKTKASLVVFLLSVFIVFGSSAFCQKNKQKPFDSTLEANCEKWKVKLHKGPGKGKPKFGPYTTSNVEKADSPVFKQRTKTGSYKTEPMKQHAIASFFVLMMIARASANTY